MENKYYKLSKKYLKDARGYLKKKKLTQASEKFWGASAQMVKAVAQEKGYSHDGHAQLFKVIHKLTELTKDRELRHCFSMAHTLHINFYEDMLKKEDIIDYAQQVEKLIEKLKNFSKGLNK